jgi:hypothetical protein
MKNATATTRLGKTGAGSARERCAQAFRQVLSLMLATVREIFDESAYQRFLAQRQLGSSRATYALFLREQETRRARQPKCC